MPGVFNLANSNLHAEKGLKKAQIKLVKRAVTDSVSIVEEKGFMDGSTDQEQIATLQGLFNALDTASVVPGLTEYLKATKAVCSLDMNSELGMEPLNSAYSGLTPVSLGFNRFSFGFTWFIPVYSGFILLV